MNTNILRFVMILILLFAVAICLCSSVLDMTLLNITTMPGEIADAATTPERRAELVHGLNNGMGLQGNMSRIIWWLGLATGLFAALLLFESFRRPRTP